MLDTAAMCRYKGCDDFQKHYCNSYFTMCLPNRPISFYLVLVCCKFCLNVQRVTQFYKFPKYKGPLLSVNDNLQRSLTSLAHSELNHELTGYSLDIVL